MSSDDFEAKLDQYLPKKLEELGVLMDTSDIVKKDSIEVLIRHLDNRFDKQLEASNKRFEEQRADFNKRFEENDKRLEELRNDFNKRFEENDKRLEELRNDFNKRFEENDLKLEKLRIDTNKRFEENGKRLDALIAKLDKRFDGVDRRIDKLYDRVQEMSIAFGHDFEEFNTLWMNDFLRAQGYKNIRLERKIFIDEEYVVNDATKNVEIDIFNEDPLVIGEVTSVVKNLSKVTKFIRKVKFLSSKFGEPVSVIFITYGFKPDIRDDALRVLQNNNVKTFTLRQREVNFEYW